MVILFDIDGTLIDHDHAEAAAVVQVHRRLGLHGTVDDFRRRWRSALERHYDRYLSGELSIQEQRRARLREAIDPTLSDVVADQLHAAYLEDYIAGCRLYPDVEPMLAQLSTYTMGVVSNGELSQQQNKLVRAGIADRFRVLIMSSECGVAKPAAAIFHLACAALDVHPSQAVYVGDRPDIDAEASRAAGLQGIWLDRAAPTDYDDVRVRIRSLSALPTAIASLERGATR